MGSCDTQITEFEEALENRNEAREELAEDRRDQLENYQEYWGEVRDAMAEYIILGLFGESSLGAALGGWDTLFGNSQLEDRIEEKHEEIQSDIDVAKYLEWYAENKAGELCGCWAEHGFD
jgi:hypothetical protein